VSRRHLYAAAAGLLVLGGALAWVASERSHPGTTSVWTVVHDDPLVGFGSEDAGTVDRSLAKKALRIAREDPTFRLIVGQAQLTVVGTSIYGEEWSNSVTVKLRIRRKGTVTAELPSIDYTGSSTVKAPEYCRLPHHVVNWIRDKATGIFAVYVTADLKSERVLQIWTRARRHVYSWAPGRPPHLACPQSTVG
jgi:hypothetical protein